MNPNLHALNCIWIFFQTENLAGPFFMLVHSCQFQIQDLFHGRPGKPRTFWAKGLLKESEAVSMLKLNCKPTAALFSGAQTTIPWTYSLLEKIRDIHSRKYFPGVQKTVEERCQWRVIFIQIVCLIKDFSFFDCTFLDFLCYIHEMNQNLTCMHMILK